MKYVIALVLSLAATPAFAMDDKTKHALAGVVTSQVVGEWAEKNNKNRWVWGCGSAAVVGLTKEFYDAQGHGNVEAKDFLATAIAGCASLTFNF